MKSPPNGHTRSMVADGVVLAAGLSSRAGSFKPALDLGGRTVIERCLDSMRETCARIVVVGGYRYDELAALLQRYAGVELVYNPEYRSGMFGSIRAGLARVRAPGFFLTPGDCPAVAPATYAALARTVGEIVIPTHAGHPGHPLFARSRLIGEILQDRNCRSLEQFIAARKRSLLEVGDPGILLDVDTPADYRRALAYLDRGPSGAGCIGT